MNFVKTLMLAALLFASAPKAHASECEKKTTKLEQACKLVRGLRDGLVTDPVLAIGEIWRTMAKAGARDLAKLGTSEEELQALRDRFYQGVERQSRQNIVNHAESIKAGLSRNSRFSPNIFNFLLSSVGNYQEALFRQGKQYPDTRPLTDKLAQDMGLPIALPANPSGQ